MSKIIIDATHTGELRVAVTGNRNKLIDLDIERESQQLKKSNIYKGVISSIEPSLGAVFVNFGVEKHGFLPIKDISREYYLSEPKYDYDTQSDDDASPSEEDEQSSKDIQKDEEIAQIDDKEAQVGEGTAEDKTSDGDKGTTEDKASDGGEGTTDDKASGGVEGTADDKASDKASDKGEDTAAESLSKKTDTPSTQACATTAPKRTKKSKRSKPRRRSQLPLNINEIIKVGQELVVQVEKEERGNKGAALSTFISLAGAYLVLMPNNPGAGGVSRRIEGDEREQIRKALAGLSVPDDMGLIVRTAGVGKETQELQWDLNILFQYWEAVKQAAVAEKGPYLIHQESDAVIRAIRDYLREDIEQIVINDKECFQRAQKYIKRIKPSFINSLKFYDESLPIFSHFQVEKQIQACYQREVRLPSGGSIVIDHTEALVSVDINSARATRGSDIEETALHTNLEAADEIARQLRIRDIGGLVVIDFIDMSPSRNQREVESRLKTALRMDRARIQLGKISRFGLLEMSRQRVGQALRLASHIACPQCEGQGTIRSIESLTYSLLHIMQEQAAKTPHQHFHLQLPVDTATYMINEKRQSLNQIELNYDAHITIIPNPHIVTPNYILKQNKVDPKTSEQKHKASYKLLRQPKMQLKLATLTKQYNEPDIPAIHKYLPADLNTPKQPPTGLFKQLWNKVLGIEPTEQPTESASTSKQNTAPRKTGGNRRTGGKQHPRRKAQTGDKKEGTKTTDRTQKTNSPKSSPSRRQGGNKKPTTRRTEGNKEPKAETKPTNKDTATTKTRSSSKPKGITSSRTRKHKTTKTSPQNEVKINLNATPQEKIAAEQLQDTIKKMQQYTRESIRPTRHADGNQQTQQQHDPNGNIKASDKGTQSSKPVATNRQPRSSRAHTKPKKKPQDKYQSKGKEGHQQQDGDKTKQDSKPNTEPNTNEEKS